MKQVMGMAIWAAVLIAMLVVLAGPLHDWTMGTAMAQAPGFSRFKVLIEGISVITGQGVNYQVVDGYVDLPSGVDWYQSLITKGIIQPIYSTMEVTGDLAVGGVINIAPAAAVTVTTNGVITPTGSYQPLTAEGNVATGQVASGAAGDVLYLQNVAESYTIAISDTGTLKLGGDRVLGLYDTLTLISDGVNWVEMGFTNN